MHPQLQSFFSAVSHRLSRLLFKRQSLAVNDIIRIKHPHSETTSLYCIQQIHDWTLLADPIHPKPSELPYCQKLNLPEGTLTIQQPPEQLSRRLFSSIVRHLTPEETAHMKRLRWIRQLQTDPDHPVLYPDIPFHSGDLINCQGSLYVIDPLQQSPSTQETITVYPVEQQDNKRHQIQYDQQIYFNFDHTQTLQRDQCLPVWFLNDRSIRRIQQSLQELQYMQSQTTLNAAEQYNLMTHAKKGSILYCLMPKTHPESTQQIVPIRPNHDMRPYIVLKTTDTHLYGLACTTSTATTSHLASLYLGKLSAKAHKYNSHVLLNQVIKLQKEHILSDLGMLSQQHHRPLARATHLLYLQGKLPLYFNEKFPYEPGDIVQTASFGKCLIHSRDKQTYNCWPIHPQKKNNNQWIRIQGNEGIDYTCTHTLSYDDLTLVDVLKAADYAVLIKDIQQHKQQKKKQQKKQQPQKKGTSSMKPSASTSSFNQAIVYEYEPGTVLTSTFNEMECIYLFTDQNRHFGFLCNWDSSETYRFRQITNIHRFTPKYFATEQEMLNFKGYVLHHMPAKYTKYKKSASAAIQYYLNHLEPPTPQPASC